MFNWISLYLCNYVVSLDAFHQPNTTGTYAVHESALTMILPNWKLSAEGQAALANFPVLRDVLVRCDVNVGIIVAVVVAILIGWLLKRTKVGYEMRAVGLNKDAACFAGINVEKNIVLCMVISGGLCGLAGALNITGILPHGISTLAAFENNGFNGLSVAFIAGCSPVGCIPAALLFAGLIYGGQTVQQTMGAPSEIISIMIGTIVFCMALGGVIPMLAEHIQRSRAERAEQARKLAAEAGTTPVAAPAGESDASRTSGSAGASSSEAEASSKTTESNGSNDKKGADGDAR
jgi:simple sugar transport system permease protein